MSYQTVLEIRADGALVLDCGHIVRRAMRKTKVICETCQPERFAKNSANGKVQWKKFRARWDAKNSGAPP